MRIIFAGTPQAACPTFQALIDSPHEIVAALTRPPARTGRGRQLHPSPVAELATQHGSPLVETSSLRDESIQQTIRDLHADLGVVVAYGALVPQSVLDMPTHGWVNLHFSDLPQWRGAAPVQWAIVSGQTQTASCVFQLEAGLDTGPVFSRLPVGIRHETSGELLERMAILGAQQVLDVVDSLAEGTAQAVPQVLPEGEELPHARRLEVNDGFIDFTQDARVVDARIRSVIPSPGAWTTLGGQRVKLGAVSLSDQPTPGVGRMVVSKKNVLVGCADVCVELGQLAPAGKSWMDAAAWARGARLSDDSRMGEPLTNEKDR